MQERQPVVLRRDLPEHGLVEGDIGTIVHVYGDGEGFEVEFVLGDGRTLGVETLSAEEIRAISASEIGHARDTSSA